MRASRRRNSGAARRSCSAARTARVNEMGAHSDSGQHHAVRPSTPSTAGTGTPQSMLPVMREGSSVLPVRKRTPAAARASRAVSRSCQLSKVRSDYRLALLHREPVGGQRRGHLVVGRAERVLDADHGGEEPLGDGRGHHGAHARVRLLAGDLPGDEVMLRRQIEVPVRHGAQLGVQPVSCDTGLMSSSGSNWWPRSHSSA